MEGDALVNKRKFQRIILVVMLVNGQGLTGGPGQRADTLIDMDAAVIAMTKSVRSSIIKRINFL